MTFVYPLNYSRESAIWADLGIVSASWVTVRRVARAWSGLSRFWLQFRPPAWRARRFLADGGEGRTRRRGAQAGARWIPPSRKSHSLLSIGLTRLRLPGLPALLVLLSPSSHTLSSSSTAARHAHQAFWHSIRVRIHSLFSPETVHSF